MPAAFLARQAGPRPQAVPSCDRACLLAVADRYLAALVAHDPSKAPMAPAARFTEQGQVMAVGEGSLWKNATGVSNAFRIPVADPVAGQIGMIVMVKESGDTGAPDRDVELALRLKVVNRQVTEAEHAMARITNPAALANLQTPRPALLATATPAARLPRGLMLLIGNSYYDSIVQSDGDAAPYANDCGRRENGMHTAGAGAPAASGAAGGSRPPQSCRDQMNSRSMSYITSIDLRRVWIADEEKGLVFGLTMFRHPMEFKSWTILNPDGTTGERVLNRDPFDTQNAHIFKISSGMIREIEAMGFARPLNSKNGWSPFVR